MKKNEAHDDDEMLPEYDLSGGVRGRHAARYAEGTNLVLLDPDVWEVYPDSQSVNDALRKLIQISKKKQTLVALQELVTLASKKSQGLANGRRRKKTG